MSFEHFMTSFVLCTRERKIVVIYQPKVLLSFKSKVIEKS